MSIKKKVQKLNPEDKFVHKIENTLLDIIDTDEPVHGYMHIDICKVLEENEELAVAEKYKSGDYHLRQLTKGNYDRTLKVLQALYDTCLRFDKHDLALIITTEVTKALLECKVSLNWVDGRFVADEEVV